MVTKSNKLKLEVGMVYHFKSKHSNNEGIFEIIGKNEDKLTVFWWQHTSPTKNQNESYFFVHHCSPEEDTDITEQFNSPLGKALRGK